MASDRLSRRRFLAGAAVGTGLLALAGCAPKVIKETVVVEKEKLVQKEVTKVVQAPKQPITLRLNMRAGGEKSEAPIYVTRPNEFTQETGIQVQLEPIPGGEYWAKIETMAVSGTIGDNVFTTQLYWGHSRLAHFGILLPLDDYMASANIKRDEWLPNGIDSCTIGGKTYGLPKTCHPTEAYIWINQKLFQEAGLPIPQEFGTTWDQIREWSTKLAKGPKDKRDVYGFYAPTKSFSALICYMRSFGGWELDEKGGQAAIDSAAEDWIKWLQTGLVKEKTSPHDTELGAAGVYGMFAAGKIGMVQGGCWYYSPIKEAVEKSPTGKFPWSVIGLPEGPKFNKWGSSLNTHAPTKQSKYKEEAFRLQYALADKRMAYLIANEIGYLVGRTKELEEIGKAKDDPYIKLQYAEHLRAKPYRIGRNFRGTEFSNTVINMLDSVMLGKTEPAPAFFNELRKALNDILERPVE